MSASNDRNDNNSNKVNDPTTYSQYNWKLYNEILEKEDIGPFIDCMTCGKCVGDCIAAENSDFNFRRIIQKILEGDREALINSDDIWKCFLCDLCTIKCPKSIQIKKLILILRKMALEAGRGCEMLKYLSDLPTSFLEKGLIYGKTDKNLRTSLGLKEDYKLNEKALKEFKSILKDIGAEQHLKGFIENCKKEFIKSIIKGDKEK